MNKEYITEIDTLKHTLMQYAYKHCKNNHGESWYQFYKRFTLATGINLSKQAHAKDLSIPEWLCCYDYIDTAVRIAEGMMNKKN